MFDQSTIDEVKPPVWDGASLHLEWTSSAPPGTIFQVYLGGRLAWHGTSRWVALPMPPRRVRIDIGSVGPGEGTVDFSSQLPAAPADRALLSWLGGTYLDPTGRDDLAGFRIYGERVPGGGVDFSKPLAELPAYPGGIQTDGFGLGGFGQGGFGRSASAYRWSSPPLGLGTWTFAVVPVLGSGAEGAPALRTVTITAPPRPPAAFPDGTRLRLVYDPDTQVATLSWQPSPG
jgi:hypothetical protein